MEVTKNGGQNFVQYSLGISLISLILAVIEKLSFIGLSIGIVIFIVNVVVFFFVQNKESVRLKFNNFLITEIDKSAISFLLCTSLLGLGLGLISWIFLIDRNPFIRNVLLQISPLILWGIGVIIFLLGKLGALLRTGENKVDGLLIASVLFSVFCHFFIFWLSAKIFSYTIDDAFITFRYSKNLAAGFGPTFNPGQSPVEGYTTFLWMLLMTLPHLININVDTFSKIIGILLTCGTISIITLTTNTLLKRFSARTRIFF